MFYTNLFFIMPIAHMYKCNNHPHYVSVESSSTTQQLIPVTSLPRVFELYYYANNVTSVFLLDSLLGKSKRLAILTPMN